MKKNEREMERKIEKNKDIATKDIIDNDTKVNA